MEPFVGIVISRFKRAPFLKYALEELSMQMLKNFEVIVVVKPWGL
jgi:glycosyltransferase involved in cell wall biosynthesis